MWRARWFLSACLLLMISLPGQRVLAASATGDDAALAQKLTNPIADLVSLPIQFNWRHGVGVDDDLQGVVNLQPVVPFRLTESLGLVARFIVPVVSQPVLVSGGAPASGLGDAVLSLFLSPRREGAFQWGVGPVLLMPLTADPRLGGGQWGAGPTAVALYLKGPWTFVLLANHLWSFARTGDRPRGDVDRTFVQPAVSYTTPGAWTLTLTSESEFDWTEEDEATVPVQLLVSRLTALGALPLSVQAGGGWYAATRSGGPEWQLRLAFTLLVPVRDQ